MKICVPFARTEGAFIFHVKIFIENQYIVKVSSKIVFHFLVCSNVFAYLRPPKNYGSRDSGGLHKKQINTEQITFHHQTCKCGYRAT